MLAGVVAGETVLGWSDGDKGVDGPCSWCVIHLGHVSPPLEDTKVAGIGGDTLVAMKSPQLQLGHVQVCWHRSLMGLGREHTRATRRSGHPRRHIAGSLGAGQCCFHVMCKTKLAQAGVASPGTAHPPGWWLCRGLSPRHCHSTSIPAPPRPRGSLPAAGSRAESSSTQLNSS